jgi:IS30 family transposase
MWEERLNELTDADRQRIWLLRDEGIPLAQLAKRFNCSIATISRVCSDRRQRTNLRSTPAAKASGA